VYKGIQGGIEALKCQKIIDPHFSDNKNFYSPIARFVPTDDGWRMAEAFCEVAKRQENL
jgi:hypothetical protein